jgi:hypothetical protein
MTGWQEGPPRSPLGIGEQMNAPQSEQSKKKGRKQKKMTPNHKISIKKRRFEGNEAKKKKIQTLKQLRAQDYRLNVAWASDPPSGRSWSKRRRATARSGTWTLVQGSITIKSWDRLPTLSEILEISSFKRRERLEVARPNPKGESDSLVDPREVIALPWEIFPPGTVDEVVRFFSKGMKGNRGEDERILRERVEAFAALKPEAYIQGIGGFKRYIGAKFSDDLVVFENRHYGNALYILYENWEKLSKRPRLDLLRDTDAHFDRIVHATGWREQLEETIRRERPRQPRP